MQLIVLLKNPVKIKILVRDAPCSFDHLSEISVKNIPAFSIFL